MYESWGQQLVVHGGATLTHSKENRQRAVANLPGRIDIWALVNGRDECSKFGALLRLRPYLDRLFPPATFTLPGLANACKTFVSKINIS
jgi:hypothetical protein